MRLDHSLMNDLKTPRQQFRHRFSLDICPHERTYPKKAVAIDKIKIVTPLNHVKERLNE
jgi:hypothetical protein